MVSPARQRRLPPLAGARGRGSVPPEAAPAVGLPDVNNDHALSPDGGQVFASASDWRIWTLPLVGGRARSVTADDGGDQEQFTFDERWLPHVAPTGGRRRLPQLPAGGELVATSNTARGGDRVAEVLQALNVAVQGAGADLQTAGKFIPNGAGKTTLMKMLPTLLPPTSGTARVAGMDVTREACRVRSQAAS